HHRRVNESGGKIAGLFSPVESTGRAAKLAVGPAGKPANLCAVSKTHIVTIAVAAALDDGTRRRSRALLHDAHHIGLTVNVLPVTKSPAIALATGQARLVQTHLAIAAIGQRHGLRRRIEPQRLGP